MAQFDAADFGQRMRKFLPRSWWGERAYNGAVDANGNPVNNPATNPIYWALTNGLGSGYASEYFNQQYTKLQTRLMTSTDINLDGKSADFFAGTLPRLPSEPDPSFAIRIAQQVVAPKGTIAAIYQAVTTFFALYGQWVQGFSLGVGGAAGVQGTLGVQAYTPTKIRVFDAMTDPTTSAAYAIAEPLFAIWLQFTGITKFGFAAGESYVGADSYVIPTLAQVVNPASYFWGPQLIATVNAVKAGGATPLYLVATGA